MNAQNNSTAQEESHGVLPKILEALRGCQSRGCQACLSKRAFEPVRLALTLILGESGGEIGSVSAHATKGTAAKTRVRSFPNSSSTKIARNSCGGVNTRERIPSTHVAGHLSLHPCEGTVEMRICYGVGCAYRYGIELVGMCDASEGDKRHARGDALDTRGTWVG